MPRIIAREEELQVLADVSRECIEFGAPRLTLVRGGSGQGKTTLLEEYLSRIYREVPDALVLRGSCSDDSAMSRALLPIKDALIDVLIGSGSGERSETGRTIARAAAEEFGPELLSLLFPPAALVGRVAAALTRDRQLGKAIDDANRRASADTDEHQLRSQITAALSSLVFVQPVMLVLDDMQWSDATSLGLVRHLLSSVTGSLHIVIAFRSEATKSTDTPFGVHLPELSGLAAGRLIDLDESDTKALVEGLLRERNGAANPETVAKILGATGGNPYLVAEGLLPMLDRGVLLNRAGEPTDTIDEVDWDRVPAAEELVSRWLSLLDDDERKVLRLSAVAGFEFPARPVAKILGMDEIGLDELLGDLMDRSSQLLVDVSETRPTFSMSWYRFAHHMLHAQLQNEVRPGLRIKYHRRLAHLIELEREAIGPGVEGLLARHLEGSGDNEGAASNYLAIARSNLGVSAFAATNTACLKGLALLQGDIDGGSVGDKLEMETILLRGRIREGAPRGKVVERLDQIVAEAEEIGDSDRVAMALAALAHAHWRDQEFEKAQDTGHRALERLDDSDDNAELRGFIFNSLGVAARRLGQVDDAMENYLQSETIAREHNLLNRLSTALNNRGALAGMALGDNQQALECYQEALRIAEAANNSRGRVLYLRNLGQTYRRYGRFRDSTMSLEQSLQLAEGLEDDIDSIKASLDLAITALHVGDLDGAESHLRRAVARDPITHFATERQFGARFAARASLHHLRFDRLGEARDLITAFRKIGRYSPGRASDLVDIDLAEAVLRIRCDEPEECAVLLGGLREGRWQGIRPDERTWQDAYANALALALLDLVGADNGSETRSAWEEALGGVDMPGTRTDCRFVLQVADPSCEAVALGKSRDLLDSGV